MQRGSFLVFAVLTLSLLIAPPARAVSVTPSELAATRRWAGAKFEGRAETKPAEGYLSVSLKSGQVLKNMATTKVYHLEVGALPLRIADREYRRGLYCPSVGTVVVHLPGPGKSFEAVVGVDSGRVTSFYSNAGRGRVIARVEVGGKEAFRSAVMREGMAGVPVKVDLEGTTQFELGMSDAGGGIVQRVDFNQMDWAEARVTLSDGTTLWLGDLSMAPLRPAYTAEPPFSFQYGDRPSSELLKGWGLKRKVRPLDANRSEHTMVYTDPVTGLEVRCVGVEYQVFPTVEWTLYFKNTSNRPTLILESIQALDTRLERNHEGEFVLHHNDGSPHSMVTMSGPTDYQPLETKLLPGMEKRLGSMLGLPATKDLPFFNVAWPGEGVIVAIGWPGQWAGRLKRDDARGLQLQAGQELAHFRLLPGETVRTPRIAMLFWQGDWLRAQNLWRRWMMAHNMPRPGGTLPPPQLAASSSAQYIEMAEANETNQLMFIDRYGEEGIKFDYWWIDAGWHVFKDYWLHVGTWEPDRQRFPRGLRAISDPLHAIGAKMIVWYAPELVTPGSWLYENHPEWLLGREGEFKLLNLGNAEAWKWLTDHVDRQITEQGIDLYRHDGIPPLSYWRANDTQDRQGITEIRHVEGYLAYWDELRQRHPNMLSDICAGGGGRNDLESLRRAVPLWRSDYAYETTGMQNLTYGMALWIPYFGTGISAFDRYVCRSQMAPALSCIWDLRRRDLDYDFCRRFIAQWRHVADNYYGDYYPLTAYRTENDVWMAWQFDRPESGEGMVQAFRRPKSAITAMNFLLRGLDASASYTVTNLDVAGSAETTGQELMERGLSVSLPGQPDSALIVYKRLK